MNATPPTTPIDMLPCPGCGYDLHGLATKVCPECARPFTKRELWRAGQNRKWSWIWLDDTARLVFWLWVGMLAGLVWLRLLEGDGLSGWLGVGLIGIVGVAVARWQRGAIGRARSDPDRALRGPGRAMRLGVQAHTTAAILIAVPIAGMALLLGIAGVLSTMFR